MKKFGKLYGIGVGPGDPELMTIKGAKLLSECRMVFVPKSREERESAALKIAGPFLGRDSQVMELMFPMITDPQALSNHWDEAAQKIADFLLKGHDCCFLTLGDPLLYSTYIYLLRHLRKRIPRPFGPDRSGGKRFQRGRGFDRISGGRGQGTSDDHPHGR